MPTEKAFKSGSEFPKLEPGTVRLYSMRLCPYAQRSRIVLAHKNIKYETVNIHLKEKPEWYLADINPLGMVPSLQMGDKIVFDSSIVSDYLDDIYPEKKLTPSDAYAKSRDRMLLERWAKVAGPFYKLFRKGGDDKDVAEAPGELWSGLDPIEEELKNRNTTFFGGATPMMIDYMIWPHMERIDAFTVVNAALKLSPERFPLLLSWVKRMKAVPAVKQTLTSHEIYKQLYLGIREGKFDYDLGLE